MVFHKSIRFILIIVLLQYYGCHSLYTKTRACTRFGSSNLPNILASSNNSRLYGVWGNYKSDGKKEGQIIFAIALAAVLKGQFTSVDLRTTYPCPTGPNAEETLAYFKELEPDYKCLPSGELYKQILTSPLVFPGDEKWDPQFIRIQMIGSGPQRLQ